MTGGWRGMLALAIGCVALLMTVAPASAQMFTGGPSGPPISSKEFDRFVGVLRLDESQAEIAQSLFESMLSEYEDIRRDLQKHSDMLREEFEETRDPAIYEDMIPVQERARKKTKELEARFMEDLRLVITDDQAENWDRLERMRRRDKTLSNPMGVSGAGVDLIQIVDDMDLAESSMHEMSPVLERYELDLDRALVDRSRLNEEQEKKFRESHQPGEGGTMAFDIEEFQASAAAMREIELKLREVNQRFAAQLGGMMDETTRGEFDRMVREASFPKVYRRSYTGRAFDRAMGFDDLTDDQRSQIEAFRDQYDRELASVNDRWAAAEAEAEEDGSSQQMLLGGGNMVIQVGDGSQNEAVKEARLARKALDDKYYDRVKQLMTPDQADRLPRKRRGPGGNGFFAPDDLDGDFAVFVTHEIMVDDEDTGGN